MINIHPSFITWPCNYRAYFFRKSCINAPDYRVVVCNYHDPVPDSAQLLNLQRKYSDQKPILLAVGNIVLVQCIFITDPFPIFCRSVERQSHMVRIFMAIGLLDLPSIPNSNSLKGGKLYFHSSQLLHDCIFQWMKAPCPSPHSAKSPFLTSTTTKSCKWVPSLSYRLYLYYLQLFMQNDSILPNYYWEMKTL